MRLQQLDELLTLLGGKSLFVTSTPGTTTSREIGAKSLAGIVGHLFVERRVQSVGRNRAHQDGVAVGLGPGHRGSTDVAAGAAAILDHDLLAKVFDHARGDKARHYVGRAARPGTGPRA